MGKNVKQYGTFTNLNDTDFVYMIQGATDGNATLSSIKNHFGIGDVEEWKTVTIANGTTAYENIGDGTVYGAVELIYLTKRGSRGYASGHVTLLVDDSIASGVSVSNFADVTKSVWDDMGLLLNEGTLSAGTIQLKLVADASDASDTIFNYQIINKRPITV